jgi:hypothetical protein
MERGMQQQAYHHKPPRIQQQEHCKQVVSCPAKMAPHQPVARSICQHCSVCNTRLSAVSKRCKRRRHWVRHNEESSRARSSHQLAPSSTFQHRACSKKFSGASKAWHITEDGNTHGELAHKPRVWEKAGKCSLLRVWSNNTTKCSRICKFPSNCA